MRCCTLHSLPSTMGGASRLPNWRPRSSANIARSARSAHCASRRRPELMAVDRAPGPVAVGGGPATEPRAPVKPKRGSRPVPPIPRRQPVVRTIASTPRRPGRAIAAGGQPPPAAAVPAGPPLKLPAGPAATDPRFKRMLAKVVGSANRSRWHPPAKKLATEAQAASAPPQKEEQEANARATKVEAMNTAPAGKPPAEDSFLTAL